MKINDKEKEEDQEYSMFPWIITGITILIYLIYYFNK